MYVLLLNVFPILEKFPNTGEDYYSELSRYFHVVHHVNNNTYMRGDLSSKAVMEQKSKQIICEAVRAMDLAAVFALFNRTQPPFQGLP